MECFESHDKRQGSIAIVEGYSEMNCHEMGAAIRSGDENRSLAQQYQCDALGVVAVNVYLPFIYRIVASSRVKLSFGRAYLGTYVR